MKEIFLVILCISVLSCKSDKNSNTLKKSNERIGIIKFNVADGNIKDSIVEFITIDGKEYANQIWIVNKENDTIDGNYFNLIKNDTTKLGEVTIIQFQLMKPAIDSESEMYIVMPNDESQLDHDFSNLKEIKLDTFYSLVNDGIPHPEISDLNLQLNHIAQFGIEYQSAGKKLIRGMVIESGRVQEKNYIRILYFKDSLYIIE